MVKIKPTEDFSEEKVENLYYDGPPPKPGTYRGIIKKMGLATIASGDNKGAKRIALLLEINSGEFKGAGIFHSLNLTKQGSGYVNQFLEALTDGTEAQKLGIRQAFWKIGYDVEAEAEGKGGQQFIKIGKGFKPIGKEVAFVTKAGSDQQGNPRAEIARFVLPLANSEDEDSDDALDDDITDDAISDAVDDDIAEDVVGEEVSEEEDSDDPWS